MKKSIVFTFSLLAASVSYANQPVNAQITDAVTVTNVKVVSEAPAMAMGMVYQAASQCQLNNQHSRAMKILMNGRMQAILHPGQSTMIPCSQIPRSVAQYNNQNNLTFQASTTESVELIYSQNTGNATIQKSQ